MNKALFAAFALVAVSGCKSSFDQSIGTVGDTMAYDTTTFAVKTGQSVHLTLKNNGTSQAMKHNWVLTQPGKEADVANAGMTAGETLNFVKTGDTNVIASTPLSQPGSSVEVTFTAPAPGKYPYICTYPGHYQTMKGTLEVTP
ncbi:MAG TPA: plastocyanin/azurin family copper-binding protein [Polyangiaceae bacterium]